MERLKGLIPAVFTPMNEDQSLALEQIAPLTELLIKEQACAFYVCGSTGEGPMLTTEERKLVAESFISAVGGRIPVIVQVGHQALHDAADLAEHAQSVGADAIAAVPPNYFDIDSVGMLVECMARIAAGAPELPFYYYHIPRLTKVDHAMPEFLKIGSSQIPTLRGIKYTAFTIFELQSCLELDNGKFEIFFGCDEMLLSGLAVGAKATVGSTYNFSSPLYNKLIEAFDNNDINKARQLQALSIRMIRTMVKYRGQPAFKAVMKMIGVNCGPNRLPHDNLSEKEIGALKKDLEAIGFFDWAR
jgi:N-acetylneuraminate lyase